MKNLEIIYKATDDLIPYINNPRFNDEAVDAVASSIRHFGFKVPIIIDEENEIIAGHTRIKAAKKLNLHEVPCIVADDLTEEQIRAFRLADNKVSEIARWDWSLLDSELSMLDDFEMTEFGFSDDFEDIDLDDLWIDDDTISKTTDEKNYLIWNGGKTETSLADEEFLNDMLDEYNTEDPEITFVEWLRYKV